MSDSIAQHILDLEHSKLTTDRAEDRGIYEKLLAQAGAILARVNLNVPRSELYEAIDLYEKLWGTLYPSHWEPRYPEAYEKFKREVGYPGYGNN